MKRRRLSFTNTVSALESRQLLAASVPTPYIDPYGSLSIRGAYQKISVTITDKTISGVPHVRVKINSKTFNFEKSSITAGGVQFIGSNYDDFVELSATNLRLLAWGGLGNDSMFGGNLNDVLVGAHGNDRLYGGGGDDRLFGDEQVTNSADDLLSPEKGEDLLFGGVGNDTLSGGDYSDVLHGNEGDDILYGGSSNDTLDAGHGRNYAWGGTGDDRLYGGNGIDDLIGELGNDVLYGGAAFDYLYGSEGDDFLDGQADDAYYHGGIGLDCAANQPVIGGVGLEDIFQQFSSTCWFLAPLAAMTTLGATSNGADISSYMSYEREGVYKVRLYNPKKKAWVDSRVQFEGVRSTHNGDSQIRNNGFIGSDHEACEGEFWATVIHRGMLNYFGADYTTESGVKNANFGSGPGKGGSARDGLLLLGNTTATEEFAGFFKPFNTAFLSRMRGLLYRTSPVQPMIASSIGSPPSSKIGGGHGYIIVSIDTFGTVMLRNPQWGRDGGTGGDGVEDSIVTVTAAEFAANFVGVAYTTSIVI